MKLTVSYVYCNSESLTVTYGGNMRHHLQYIKKKIYPGVWVLIGRLASPGSITVRCPSYRC